MAEKGENKKLVIITICIILFLIMFSGCFDNHKENNEEKIKYVEHSDLKLELELDNNTYGINITKIILTVNFLNNNSKSVSISKHLDPSWKHFSPYTFLRLDMKYNNITLYQSIQGLQSSNERITLNPGENFSFTINLKLIPFHFKNEDFIWSKGEYVLTSRYYDNKHNLLSNTVNFELI